MTAKPVIRKSVLEKIKIKTLYRMGVNMYKNRFKRDEDMQKLGENYAERMRVINGMNNWQHAKMMKACRGNVSRLTLSQLKAFAVMERGIFLGKEGRDEQRSA